MKINKKLAKYLKVRKKDNSYWVEKLKLDFSMQLEKRRLKANFSYLDIAEKAGTSPAYISKIFRGDVNFTIESMVKLAGSTGGKVDINIVDLNVTVSPHVWFTKTSGLPNASNSNRVLSGVTEARDDLRGIAA